MKKTTLNQIVNKSKLLTYSVCAMFLLSAAKSPDNFVLDKNNINLKISANSAVSQELNNISMLPVENAILTDPPNVPPPIKRKSPAKVIVDMEIIEKIGKLADGVQYTFWTFGGTVPGKFIRVREGDTVEFHLKNHQDNKAAHNIDLHAVTGPGGGAKVSLVAPGKEVVFSFKVINPGLFIYHCAAPPVPVHIANGMYGLILVEPKDGLPPVDKEYYVVQSDFYTKGKFGEKGLQQFDMDKGIDEKPTYVVFNGMVNSLVDKPLTAKKGETARIYFGNGGPNLTSSFHLIGEIFDNVYQEGGTIATQKNVQTTVVPPGGSAMAEFKTDVPGDYILVDHAIFRAFNKGAIGILNIEGSSEPDIYSGKQSEKNYISPLKINNEKVSLDNETTNATIPSGKNKILTLQTSIKLGKTVYDQSCVNCHQTTGLGIPGVFPNLAKSDYLMADKNRSINVVLNGLSGKIKVNGNEFNGQMPSHAQFSDVELAAVLNYVRNSWGNKGEQIGASDIKAHRKK